MDKIDSALAELKEHLKPHAMHHTITAHTHIGPAQLSIWNPMPDPDELVPAMVSREITLDIDLFGIDATVPEPPRCLGELHLRNWSAQHRNMTVLYRSAFQSMQMVPYEVTGL